MNGEYTCLQSVLHVQLDSVACMVVDTIVAVSARFHVLYTIKYDVSLEYVRQGDSINIRAYVPQLLIAG